MSPIPSASAAVDPPLPRDVPPPRPGASLTLRTVRCGAETIALTQRSVRVEPDVWIVGDGASMFAWPVEAGTRPLVVEIAPPDDPAATGVAFLASLRAIDGAVGRRLLAIGASDPGAGRVVPSPAAAALLWSELVAEERALRARAERLECAKPSTREAIFRRLLLSSDFIHSNYAEPLRVEALAQISNLSPFHFTRLFGRAMGETPHAFLVRKRVAVARRLLAAGLGRNEAAVRSGFGCRSTLFRHLRAPARRPRTS